MRQNPMELTVLKRYWHYCTEKGDFGRVVRSTASVWSAAANGKDDAAALYAAVMAGQAYASMNVPDSMDWYLSRAGELAEKRKDAWALGTICNVLGTYAIDREMNFYKAITCFTRGMEFTEGVAPACYYALEGNLAIAYYLRNNLEGLRYARDVLRHGEEVNDPFYIFIGTKTSAYLLHLSGQDAEALAMSRKALSLVDRFYDHAGVYNLYADVSAANGDDRTAEEYYLKAFEYLHNADSKSTADTYLNYGNWLLKRGDTDKAIQVLNEGLDSEVFSAGNYIYRYQFYRSLSDAFSRQGDDRRALDYFRRYHEEADSIFRLDREHSLNELVVRYETEKHRREAEQKKAELHKANRRVVTVVSVVIIVLVVLLMMVMLYCRKNRMYRLIARQYHESIEKERILSEALDACRGTAVGDKEDASTEEDGDGDSSESERLHELFCRLDRLMRDEKLYCENGLSLDSLAARLFSNRTYLSTALNRFSGVPFRTYINTLRINEAVRILSVAEDETPLKVLSDRLGFNTLSTFYRSFQTVVGMPPSRFRREMQVLAQNKSRIH